MREGTQVGEGAVDVVEDYAAAGQSGEMRGYDQGAAAAADDVGILLVGADVE